MGAARALELRAVTVDGLVEVVPYVDGRSLVDVVGRFESARGYSPAGAYGGLVPAFFRYGDAAHQWYGRGRVPAGGRGCSRATATRRGAGRSRWRSTPTRTVTWRDLTQPFRPEWDYSALGPFTFDRAQYDDAVRAVAHLFG